MVDINKRIFGIGLRPEVTEKLHIRQALATDSDIGSSVDLDKVDPVTGNPLSRGTDYTTNFGGLSDLSSRTTFARLWTAVQIQRHTEVAKMLTSDLDDDLVWVEQQDFLKEEKDHIFVREGEYTKKKKIDRYERVIYEIGDYNFMQHHHGGDGVNERVGNISSQQSPASSDILPNIGESNQNEYLKPQTGITSVTSITEGALGVTKKTNVNFVVHNFHDFDKIYSKYFLRPGALLFVDYGWDTANLYNPREVIFDDLSGGRPLDKTLFGKRGVVNKGAGDLDVIMGYVTDYTADIQEDGSFNCSVTITSKNHALLDHSYKENDGLYNKIVNNLDTEVINFAARHFKNGKEFLKSDWNSSVKGARNWNKVAEKYAHKNLQGDLINLPTIKNVISGVYWQTTKEKEKKTRFEEVTEGIYQEITWWDDSEVISNSKNVYISWGFFEDKILNEELGIATSVKDIKSGKNAVTRYDSSQSFVRFDANLYNRQIYEKDPTKLNFLYPHMWDKTYSTKRKKDPIRKVPPGWREKAEQNLSYGNATSNTSTEDVPIGGSTFDAVLSSNPMTGMAWMTAKSLMKYAQSWYEIDEATLQEEGAITKLDKENKRVPIREIFISTAVIKDAFKTANNVKDALRKILDAIESTSEDIFDLQFHALDHAQTKLSIIDSNFVSDDIKDSPNFYDELFVFKPHSPGSMVTKYDLQFSVPDGNLGNMIAIQAMSPGKQMFPFSKDIDKQLALKVPDIESDNTGTIYLPEIGNWPSERIAKRYSDQSATASDFTAHDMIFSDEENNAKTLDEIANTFGLADYGGIQNAIDELTEDAETDLNFSNTEEKLDEKTEREKNYKKESYGNARIVHNISDYYATKARKDFYNNDLPTVLPVTLNLSIYGISLLNPGDLFRVDYLPERYLNLVYFQIVEISHDISPGGWITSLKTQMRLRRTRKPKSLYLDVQDVYISRKILDTIKLNSIDSKNTAGSSNKPTVSYKALISKIKPVNVGGKMSMITHSFTFVATETCKLVFRPQFDEILKSYNESYSGTLENRLGKSTGTGGLDESGVFSGFAASSEWGAQQWQIGIPLPGVWFFNYEINIKKGETYKLLVHGTQWIIIPNNFGLDKIQKINYLFKAIDGVESNIKGKDVKPECDVCSVEYCAEESAGIWGCELDGCDQTYCDFINGWGGDDCRPKPDMCYEE